ncbi:sodium channel and clathrin linker 1-like isoform X2 [Oscarella lobularis]|uniref:sodium channel and clathrin linker 1-like isoform X2 n=1 Tax=Oscarella lobularis TaxID=121494 RepID=UPI0033143CD1
MTDGESDVEFLKDQVHRLNAALSQYQQRYPPPDDKGPRENSISTHGPKAPWLYDKRLLAPLLLEYDRTIHQLTDQVQQCKTELATLQANAQHVVAENNKLHSELRRVLELQQRSAVLLKKQKRGSARGDSHRETHNDDYVETLQKMLDAAQEERDEYAEMWQKASEEAKQLQLTQEAEVRELNARQLEIQQTRDEIALYQNMLQEMRVSKETVELENQRFLGLEVEVDRLKRELKNSKADLRTANTKVSELRRSLGELHDQIHAKDRGARAATESERSMKSRMNQLEIELTAIDSKLLSTQRRASVLQEEKSELETSCLDLRRQIETAKQQETEVIAHVRDAMQVVENALLERDQALVQESQKAQEVSRLQDTVSVLMAEAGEKTRQEVMAVKEKCNRNIGKLMDEMQRIETELAEKHNCLEKTVREKKALEKALLEKPTIDPQLDGTLDDLRSRACAAERERDAMQLKINSVLAQSRQKEIGYEQDRSQFETRVGDLERQIGTRDRDCEIMREERFKLLGDLEGLQHRLKTAEQAKEAAERKIAREAAAWQQRHDLKEKEFGQRLEGSGEAHRQTSQELRHLLSAQQRIGAKWREESRALASKFEKTVAEMKDEIARHRRRSEVLSYELNTVKGEKEEYERRTVELSNAQTRLKRIVAEVEGRASAASRQVNELLSRERQLLEERKILHRELDQIKLRSRAEHVPAGGGGGGGGDWDSDMSFLNLDGERDLFTQHHSTALDLDAFPTRYRKTEPNLSGHLSMVADHE